MASQSQRLCQTCNRKTLHEKRQSIGDGFGLLLTVVTGGLFLIAWLVMILIDLACQPWRCQTCGGES